MTSREKRLLRLAHLRERQHDIAALSLRAARRQLAAAESALTEAQEQTRSAALCRFTAATKDDANEWLLACADLEVGALTVEMRQAELGRAQALTRKAVETETAARCERKQMEATLAVLQRECAQRATRKEQGTLDEIARLQRAGLARRSPSRRDL